MMIEKQATLLIINFASKNKSVSPSELFFISWLWFYTKYPFWLDKKKGVWSCHIWGKRICQWGMWWSFFSEMKDVFVCSPNWGYPPQQFLPLLLKPVILQLIKTVFNQGASASPTIVRNGFFRRAAADPDGRAQMGESDAACDVTNWFNNASAARGFQFALNNATRRELHVLQFVFSSSLTTKATLWTTLACKENERKKIKTNHWNRQHPLSRAILRRLEFFADEVIGWLPSRGREKLGSLCCHSPVQCCLNLIRQGSTVKRLKA